jgi:hypothetical protein
VYLYETKAGPEQAQALFALLTEDINEIYREPRMYNTLMHNCTNELTRPVEHMSDVDFPLTWKAILPGFFDEVLYELELIDTTQSFADTKDAHYIDNDAVDATDATYSTDLRAARAVAQDV